MNTVYHAEQGTGRPLILIHGFCETGEIWGSIAEKLSASYKVITPDLPGFGRSAPLQAGFSLRDVGAIMLEWMNPWRRQKPVVIGHSLGGYITLSMADQKAVDLGAIGLFHSTAYADTDEKKENRNKVIAFVNNYGVEAYTETFVQGLFFDKESHHIPWVKKMAAQTLATTLTGYVAAMRDRSDHRNVLETFTKPVALIAGEKDSVIPEKQILEQSTLARHAVFCSIINAGHMGMLENEPASIKIMDDFMNFEIPFLA